MLTAPAGDTWLGLSEEPLPVDEARHWSTLASTGAQVVFTGTVRDHAEGRDDVIALEYEAYEEQVVSKLAAIADDVRREWPDVARIALLHRVGRLELTDVSVVVAVSAPHRGTCFEAARHAIDTLKVSVPIWKKEIWNGGEDWGTGAASVRPVGAVEPSSR